VNIHQISRLVLLQLVNDKLVALSESLASIVAPKVRLDLNDLLLIS